VRLLSRLSVLLNSRGARVRFIWMGEAQAAAREALHAAGVEVVADGEADAGCYLSDAWAFVHACSGEQLPLPVAHAMAVGVPCMVSDTAAHRILVRHAENGFICASERDFLDRVVVLLRDPAERLRIGEAAREDAERRFTLRQLEDAILRAYGFTRPVGAGVDSLHTIRSNAEGAVWTSMAT
jgi:glycosyltransferase involved in cell wall biosynthesis